MNSEFDYGNDFGSPDETYLSSQFDRPVMVHRYPAAVKAFYMEPDPENAKSCALRRRAGAGGLWGGDRRVAAYHLLRSAEEADRGAPVCRSKPFPGIWICAATVRFPMRASAWASSAWWPGSAAWSMCARRFHSRGRSTGSIPSSIGDAQKSAQRQAGIPFRPSSTQPANRADAGASAAARRLPITTRRAFREQIRILGVPLDLGQSRRGVDMGPSACG